MKKLQGINDDDYGWGLSSPSGQKTSATERASRTQNAQLGRRQASPATQRQPTSDVPVRINAQEQAAPCHSLSGAGLLESSPTSLCSKIKGDIPVVCSQSDTVPTRKKASSPRTTAPNTPKGNSQRVIRENDLSAPPLRHHSVTAQTERKAAFSLPLLQPILPRGLASNPSGSMSSQAVH